MPFWAAAGAILGLGSSIMGGMQQQSAAREANELAEKQAKAQFARAKKEYQIDWWQQRSNWLWQTAQVEAQRFAERQKESDYNWRASRMVESAMQNLAINSQAINDKFVVEESLRSKQVGMDYQYKMQSLAMGTADALNQVSANVLELNAQRARIEMGAIESVRQYMSSVKDSALQSLELTNRTNREGQELVSSMVFESQKDQLKWEIGQIAAVVDSAEAEARASARQGGSGTGARLAMNTAQALGRTWGEMELQSRNRQARLGLLNSAMRGETATQLGRLALSMQDQAERMKYTRADMLVQVKQVDAKTQREINQGQYVSQKYAADAAYETSVFRDLTIPSFALAARQGAREMQSLQIQTQGILNEASMPYRQSIIFDPIKPIKGLKPEYMAPTRVYEPSTAGIIGNSILSGVQGAINMGTFTKADGTMGWR